MTPLSANSSANPADSILLDRGLRHRRVELLATLDIDPGTDFGAVTGWDAGCHTRLLPPPPPAVARHLVTVEHVVEPSTGRVRRRSLPLGLRHGNGYELPWGVAELVRQAARCRGRTSAAGSPGGGRSAGIEAAVPDSPVSAALRAHQRLVVRHGRGVDVARVLAGLVHSLPGRRVAVIAVRRRDVGRLTSALRGQGIDARGFYSPTVDDAHRPQVAVGTASGLTSPAARHTACSLVVALDATHFSGSGGASLRYETAWADAYWLGLVPDDRKVSPVERDRLVGMFGPRQLGIPAPGMVRRQVLFTARPVVLPGGGRDRVVMAMASALVATSRRPVGDRLGGVRPAADSADSVVVLADDDRHRRTLYRVRRQTHRDRVQVVSPAGLATLTGVGVLVRADSRPHRPLLSSAALVEPQTARRPLVVVDTSRPGDPLACRREAAYRAAGWDNLTAAVGGFADWDRWVWQRHNCQI